MRTIYIVDTGVFVRCGGPDKDKFQRLRRAVRQAEIALRIPQRVYEELGGDPTADAYPSGNIPYPDGFEENWIFVADELDYTDPLVSRVMDEARRFIAKETDRDEDNGNNFAIGCISTGLFKEGGEVFGPQVPSIRNRNNLWWSDQ